MDVAVIPKPSPRRDPRALVPSLLGRGLPERLRSTTLALIGVVAAASLGMVGLTLQHGLPLASSGPIHEPVEAGVGPAQALTEPRPERRRANPREPATSVSGPAGIPRSAAAAEPTPGVAPPAADRVVRDPVDSGRGGGSGRRKAPPSAVPVGSNPAPAASSPPLAEEAVATPSREQPEPVSEELAEEPVAVPGNGHAYGKGGGSGPEGAGPPGLAKK